MDGIRDPSAAAVMPALSDAGTAGWATETPGARTKWRAQAYNHLRGELKSILDAAGVAEDPLSIDQVVTVLKGAFGVVASDVAFVISSSRYKFAALASQLANVSGEWAALVATGASSVTGNYAAAMAGVGHQVLATCSATIGGVSTILTGERSVLLGSSRAKLVGNNKIGWGYHAADDPTGAATNQHLTGVVDAETGNVHHAGTAKFGGDPNDGTGAKVSIEGATGAVTAQGNLATSASVVAGGAVSASAKSTFAGGLATVDDDVELDAGSSAVAAGGLNSVGGRISVLTWATGAGSYVVLNLANNRIGLRSRVYAVAQTASGKRLTQAYTQYAAGAVLIYFHAPDGILAGDAATSIAFDVMNPADPPA